MKKYIAIFILLFVGCDDEKVITWKITSFDEKIYYTNDNVWFRHYDSDPSIEFKDRNNKKIILSGNFKIEEENCLD